MHPGGNTNQHHHQPIYHGLLDPLASQLPVSCSIVAEFHAALHAPISVQIDHLGASLHTLRSPGWEYLISRKTIRLPTSMSGLQSAIACIFIAELKITYAKYIYLQT